MDTPPTQMPIAHSAKGRRPVGDLLSTRRLVQYMRRRRTGRLIKKSVPVPERRSLISRAVWRKAGAGGCICVMIVTWIAMAEFVQNIEHDFPKPYFLRLCVNGSYVMCLGVWALWRFFPSHMFTGGRRIRQGLHENTGGGNNSTTGGTHTVGPHNTIITGGSKVSGVDDDISHNALIADNSKNNYRYNRVSTGGMDNNTD
eukprot:Lankesteria_metandrocarpae@DN7628_c0_g1_i1.p1